MNAKEFMLIAIMLLTAACNASFETRAISDKIFPTFDKINQGNYSALIFRLPHLTCFLFVTYNSYREQNNLLRFKFGLRKIDLNSFNIATSETARDINRRIILNLIRTRQPISRADLARLTGLQRSTVSLIIEQLIAEQWITEGALGHLPRGRKPRFLHLNNERAGIIGVNVRPKLTTIALTDLNANFITQDSLATPSNPQLFLEQLAERIENLRKAHSKIFCEGIGVGVPGRVNRKSHKMVFAPNLGWRNVEFKNYLEKVTGLPVEVENAANSCALYELWL